MVIVWSLGRLSSRAQPATAPVGLGVWRIFDELLPPRHLWSGSSAPRTMICLKYHLGKLQNSQRSFGIFNYEVKPTLLSKLITYQSLLFRVRKPWSGQLQRLIAQDRREVEGSPVDHFWRTLQELSFDDEISLIRNMGAQLCVDKVRWSANFLIATRV